MIQGKYLAEWTAIEFVGLSDLAHGKMKLSGTTNGIRIKIKIKK